MTRTAGARIGCQRPSRFWGLGCPKIYHEVEDTLVSRRALRQRENKVGLRTRRPVIWEPSTEQQRACEVVA
ncbi:hypothetical protein [Thiolapillus sp.]|uniref:hypothetical protein n=1 Tax=Thiolapillus sp. TaxID=2017437 RepID=UPI0025E6D806|nr:hypothetical protein [Thiolapillus sp.]